MRHKHRLSALKMRIAGHHRFAGASRLLHQCKSPGGEPSIDQIDLLAHIEAQVGGDLLIAAAPCVQL